VAVESNKNSNLIGFKRFQIASNFDCPKNALPELKFFEIKYGFEGLEKMNNFLHRNVFRFGRDLE
jgi:hypothetical protein